MPKVNSSVIGCSNSTYKINKRKKETCTEHNLKAEGNCKKKGDCVEFKPPIHVYTFPGPIKYNQLKEGWVGAVKREPFDKKRSWKPAPSDRVCSIHFDDGLATDENPIPALVFSYESKEEKSRRTLIKKPLEKNLREGDITPATSTSQEEKVPLQANFIDGNLDINMKEINEPKEVIPGDHTYCLPNNHTLCYACQDKSNLVKALASKINKLNLKNRQLKHR